MDNLAHLRELRGLMKGLTEQEQRVVAMELDSVVLTDELRERIIHLESKTIAIKEIIKEERICQSN